MKRMMKKTLLVMTSAVAMHAYAVAPGFYMGLMTGPATNTGGTQQVEVRPGVTTPATPRSNQWGSRVYLGYKVNNYAGIEGGLNYFSKISYDTKGVATCSGVDARVRDFDVVGKGNLQFSDFEIFGKAGVAITYLTTSGALNPGSNPNGCGQTQHTTKFRPTVSVGASYDLSQNWVADVSWNRTMVGSPVNNIDFYALGISYHFVNVYCGQFLC